MILEGVKGAFLLHSPQVFAMKLCPQCQHCFEDRFIACARDRSTLICDRPGACIIAHKYSLERLLVSGGAQAVYAGRHLETDRPYSIMLLTEEPGAAPKALKNFRRRALATAQRNTLFDHQHAARTYDHGRLPDGTVYVITELVLGQSLRQYMDEMGPLSINTAVRIAQQVADGLEAAHRCGVVHHDLTPANIILVRDYYQQLEAKIVNFGFAQLLKQKAVTNVRSVSSQSDNSFSHDVAPEWRRGRNTDTWPDIHSLGVTLFEMLAGRPPFGAGAETAAGHDGEAEQMSEAWLHYELPEPLAQLLTQQLHSGPTARPLSAAEVAGRLRAIGNILVPDSAAAPFKDDQAVTECAAYTRTVGDATADAEFVIDVDLNSPQDKSESNADELHVTSPVRAQLTGQVKRPSLLSSVILSILSFGSRFRARALRLKSADVMGRAYPLYLIYAVTLILGLAGGLWVGSSNSSASLATKSQTTLQADSAEPAASAETSSVSGVDESSARAANSVPAGAENPTHAATPVTGNERNVRLATPDDKSGRLKDSGANLPTASADSGKAAIGSNVSVGREPGRRQAVGPCRLLVSEHSLSIRAGGGSDTITVSSQSVDGPARVTASTKNWPDIVVFPESKGNSSGPVRYSVISVGKRAGTFAVNFSSPCGTKSVPVTVQRP